MIQQTPKSRVRLRGSRVAAIASLFGVFVLLFTSVFLYAYTRGGYAVSPNNTVNFQARLETTSGAIAADGNYNVEFKLYDGLTGGTNLWTETRTGANKVRVQNGYLTVNLGSVTAFPTNMNWAQQLYLTMNIGGTGTPSYDGEMSPRLMLTATPYAFSAGNLSNVSGSGFTTTVNFQGATGQNQTVRIPDNPTRASDDVCLLSLQNCVGSGGGITGSGLQNYVAKFNNAAGTTIGNSSIFSDGTIVGINATSGNGLLTIQGAAAAQNSIFVQGASGATAATAVIKQGSTQTGNLIEFQDNAGNVGGSINSTGNVLSLGKVSASGTVSQGKIIFGDGTTDNYSLTLQTAALTNNLTVNIPASTGNGGNNIDSVCLRYLANCTGTGGGIAGGGTQNYLAKFNTAGGNNVGDANGNASLYDNGSFLGLGTTTNSGLFSVQGYSATQSSIFVQAAASASVPSIIVKAATTQSGDLFQNQDNAGTPLSGFAVNGNLYFMNSGFKATIAPGTLTANQTYTLPTTGGTLLTTTAADASYIQNQNGTTQTGTFKINGTGTAATFNATTNIQINSSGTNKLSINTATTADNGAQVLIATGAIGNKGLVVQATAGQTASLVEVQGSTGSNLFTVTASGAIVAASDIVSTSGNFRTNTSTSAAASVDAAFGSGGTSGGGNSGSATLSSGAAAGASSGNVYITSGTATGTSKTTGSIAIDAGTASGGATAGNITIGATNATSIGIGRSGITTNNAGNFGVNNTNGANPFAVNALTTAAANYQAAIGTNGTGNNGLVIQGVASQTGATTLLNVQNSTGGSFFQVSGTGTVQGANYNITSGATGYSKNYTAGTGGVTANDVVVFANDGGNGRIIDSTTAYDTRVAGVALNTVASGATSSVIIAGAATVRYTGTAPAIGDQLVVSATSGNVMVDNNATQGILGYATAAGSGGTVTIRIQINGGQATPTFQGNVTVASLQNTGNSFNVTSGGALTATTGTFTSNVGVTGTITASGAITSGNSGTAGSIVVYSNGVANTIVGSATVAQNFTLPTAGGTLLTTATADTNYIKNQTGQQASSNFNISGSGTAANLYASSGLGINNSTNANPFAVNALTTAAANYQAAIGTNATGNNGLVIQGVASQSGTSRLLSVQSSTGAEYFFVNGNGVVQSSQGYNISSGATGYSKNYVFGTGGAAANDVVVLANDGGNGRAINSTTAYDTRVLGVATTAVANGATGTVIIAGGATVNYTGTAPAIGDQLVVSATAGKVTVDNNATQGILGYATAAGSAGTVAIRVQMTSGQSTPVFQGNVTAASLQNTGNSFNVTSGGALTATTGTFTSNVGVTGTITASGAITSGNNSTAGSIIIANGNGTNTTIANGATTAVTVTLPSATGTLALTSDTTNFIRNQTGQQTSSNFNISGTGIATTLQAGAFNAASAGGTVTTNLGTLQRTAAGTTVIDLNDTANTTLQIKNSGSGVANLNLFGGDLTTGSTPVIRLSNGGALQNITGFTQTSGNFDASGSSGTFKTSTGTVTLGGNTDIVSTASLATKAGTSFTTPGTSTSAALNVASFYTLNTSGAAQVIQGITAGRDGQRLTVTNINAAAVTLSNNSASATGSKIITGTGNDVTVATGASVDFIYDATGTVWRVVGGVSASGGVGVNAIGTLQTTPSATNGAYITGTTLFLQSANGSFAGLVDTNAQTFTGLKTFTNGVTSTSINTTAGINTAFGNSTGTFSLASQGGLNVSATGDLTGVNSINSGSGNFQVAATGNVTAGTFNTNTFNGTTLTFGNNASAATIQSGTNQNLSILANGTGTLSLGNNGAANSIQIGNTTGAVTQTVNIGTNGTAGSTSNVNIGSTVAGTTVINGATAVRVSPLTTNGLVFAGGGNGTLSSGSLNLASGPVTGVLPVGNGGTGASTLTSNGILYGNGTGAVQATGAGTAGQVLLSNAGTPTFTTLGGDIASISSAGSVTIATGAITSAKILDGTIANADLSTGTFGNITGTGTLNAGGITTGFGTILTSNTITGTTINGTTGINTGSGTGTQRIDASGNLNNIVSINTTSAGGTLTTNFGTLQRTAAGTTVIDLNDSGNTTLQIKNSGTGVANLNLFGGDLTTGSTPVIRLSNAGALQNITGFTQTSGNFDASGSTGTFKTSTGTVTLGGNTDVVATASLATKAGTSFTTPGTSTSAALNVASFYTLNTSGAAQIIQGITAGRDGQRLTLTNINAASVTLANNNAGATGSKIITGTGSDITIVNGASVDFVYDATGTVWRVVGGASATGGVGVNAVGALQTTPSATNGAYITGTTLFLQSANGSFAGLVDTNAQTFAGLKTFTNGITSTSINTTAGTNTLIGNSTGSVTIGGLGAGLVQASSGGVLSSGAVDRNSATFFSNSLSVANGGTGTNTLTANGVLFGNGTSAVGTATGTAGQLLLANASGVPTFTTLGGDINTVGGTGSVTVGGVRGQNFSFASLTNGDVLQYNGTNVTNAKITNTNFAANTQLGNITGVGALTSGSIASGFGTISTTSAISTAAAITSGNATTAGSIIIANGNNTSTTLVGGGATATITLPSTTGTVALTNDATNFIRNNNTATAQSANINIQGVTGTTSTTATFKGAPTSTNPIVSFQTSGGSAVSGVGYNGVIYSFASGSFSNTQANTASALVAQNSLNTTVAAYIQGATSQSASLLELRNASSDVQSRFDGNGQLILGTVGTVTGASVQGTLGFSDGTTNGYVGSIKLAGTLGSNQNYLLPTTGGTLLTSATADTNYIKNQTTQQTSGNFNIDGTGVATTLQAGTFDTNTAAPLFIGSTNATGVRIAQDVKLLPGKSFIFSTGTGAFDLSASSGTFGTGTGAVSLNGDTTVASGKTVSVGGQTVFNGTGILQSAALSGTYSNALTMTNTANVFGGTSATLSGTVQGGSFQVGTGTAFAVNTSGQVKYADGTSDSNTLVCKNSAGQLSTCNVGYAPASGGNYIAKNASDSSSASFAGNLLSLSNTNTGAAGVLALTNSGTNSTLSVTSSANAAANQALIFANNTNASPTGDLISLRTGGTNKFSINTSGAIAATGAITGLTGITSSGSITFSGLNTSGIVYTNGTTGLLATGQLDRNSSTYFNGGALTLANGGTGGTDAPTARTSLGAAARGVNSDITQITGLTTALSVSQGGTGAATFTTNGILYGAGTGAIQASAAGTSGQLLLANGSNVPTFTTLGGDATIDSTGALTIGTGKITSGKILDGTIVNVDLAAGTFGNITGVGALTAGSITSTFGAISNGTGGIATTGALQGNTLSVTTTSTFTGLATFSGGITNNGATVFGSTTVGPYSVNTTLSASTTVDKFTTLVIPQNVAGITITLPTPSNAAAGRIVYVINTGNQAFTMQGVSITPAHAQTYVFDGNTTWTATNIDGAGSGATFVGAVDAVTRSGNGASVSGNGLYLESANATNPGVVTSGTQTFGGDKTFNGALSISNTGTGSSLNVVGSGNPVSGSALIFANNTNASPTGNLIDLRTSGTSEFSISTTGNIAASGTITGLTGITSSGTIQLSGLATNGLVYTTNSNGTLASGALDRNSSTYFNGGALTVGNGGTGATSFTQYGLLYGNNTGTLQQATVGTAGQILVSNGSVPTFTTLGGDIASVSSAGSVTIANNAITSAKIADNTVADADLVTGTFTHVTGTGALNAGSITTGFGTILTGNTITGTQINGTTGISTGTGSGTQRIDASGNLSNIGSITSLGAVSLNASGNATTTIGSSAAGAISLTSGGAINLSAGAASTISTGTSTLGITSSNFNVATTGVVTLAGNQATGDITTATTATAANITLKPGNSTANGGTAASINIFGGNQTGTSGTRNGGSINIDAGTGASANGAVNIGGTNASAVNLGFAGSTINSNGSLSIAANQNLTLQAGSGVFTQNYSSNVNNNSAAVTTVTNTSTSGAVAVIGQTLNLVGTATTGTNYVTGTYYKAPTAKANNFYTGIYFDAGYNDVLIVNNNSIINGSGVLQSAGLSGSYTGSNQFNNAANTYGGLSATLSGAVQGGSFQVGAGTAFQVNTSGQVKYTDSGATTVATVCKDASGYLTACATTGVGAAFVQGGNNFGGTTAATFGTSNNGIINFNTNNSTKVVLDTTGNLTFQQASTVATSTGNLTVQAAGANTLALNTVGAGTVNLGTTNSTTVGIGSSTAAVTINGNGTAAAVSIQAATGGTISIGTTSTGPVSINASGSTTTVNGALTVAQLLTGQLGATVTGGAVTLTGNANSSLTTTAGTLSLQGAGAVGISTTNTTVSSAISISSGNSSAGTAGTVSIDTGTSSTGTSTIAIGTGNAGQINIGNGTNAINANSTISIAAGKGITFLTGNGNFDQSLSGGTFKTGTGAVSLQGTTTVTGTNAFTVNGGLASFGGGVSITAGNTDLTTSIALKKGTDFATNGTSDNVAFGNVSLVRLTGTALQTINGIANGRDGYILTVVNAGTVAATIANNASGTPANNILTGTGSGITLPVDASITLIYDAGANRWRISGSVAAQGGYSNGVTSVGAISSGANANGATISGTQLTLTAADGSNGGVVVNGAQTFGGLKTFAGGITSGNINTTGAANTSIGNTTGKVSIQGDATTTAVSIQAASGGTLGFGNSAVAQNIAIGNTTGASGITELVGTGNYSLDGVGTSTYSFGASTVAGTIALGGTAQTGGISLGRSTATNTVTIASSVAAGNTQTINLGNSTTGTTNISIGSTAAGTTTFQSAGGTAFNYAGTANATTITSSGNASGATNALLVINNTNATPSGNLLALQAGGTNKFAVDVSGNATVAGTYNTNTLTSSQLQFGGAATANIQSASGQNLNVDTGSTTGTLNLGTTNASGITIGKVNQTTTFPGEIVLSGTDVTGNNSRFSAIGSFNSIVTTAQYGISNQMNFNPQGASLATIYGLNNSPNISGSALDITTFAGSVTGISTTSGYTGAITSGYGLLINAPSITGSKPVTNYKGILINGSSNGNGITSGAVNNFMLDVNDPSAAAGAGGTVSNYGIRIQQPSGNGAGTTNNYGLYIQGAAGGTVSYSIYNASTAKSYYAGNVSIGATGGNIGTGAGTLNVGTSNQFQVSSTGNLSTTGQSTLGGGTNQTQVIIKANSGQTSANPLLMLQNSAGVEFARINADANKNFFSGFQSGSSVNATATDNTGVGYSSLQANAGGTLNTAIGAYSLVNNTSGNTNTALGHSTLSANTTGYNNSAGGYSALGGNTSGYYNTAFGDSALFTNATGNNNSAFGYHSDVAATNLQNATAIGSNSYVSASNSLVLGCVSGTNGCGTTTKVGIGNSAPAALFSVGTSSAFQVDASGNTLTTGYVRGVSFDSNAVAPLTIGAANATAITIGNGTNTTNILMGTGSTGGFKVQAGTGGSAFQSTSDNTMAFTVENAAGANIFTVDTSTTNSLNLATNGGVESGATNWTAFGSPTVGVETTATNVSAGLNSYRAITPATPNQGAKYAISLTSGQVYNMSFSVKSSSGAPTISAFYSTNGTSSAAACAAGSYDTSGIVGGFAKYTCTFTASTTGAAFVVMSQTDATARTLYFDNLSVVAQNATGAKNVGVISIGGANSQGLTLLTLDKYAGVPFTGANPALAGSMYFDTTSNKIQCYDGSSWGACGAAPNTNVTLTPEYTGATLNGTGIGTLTSDFCANSTALNVPATGNICGTNDARNFYKWTSPQGSYQNYSIYVTYKLPSTFKAFTGSASLTGRVDSTTNAGVYYSIYQSTGSAITACGTSNQGVVGYVPPTSSSSGVANSWLTIFNDPASGCTFAPNQYIIFKINVTAQNNASAYVENLNFQYINQ